MRKQTRLSFLMLGLAVLALSFLPASPAAATGADGPPEFDSCTSILVGRLASVDGSTMTSHSCDSGTDRTWMTIVPEREAQARGDGQGLLRAEAHQGAERSGPSGDGRDPAGRGDLRLPQRGLSDHERAPAGDRRDDDRQPGRPHERERHHRRARALPPRPRAGEDGPRGHPHRRRADEDLGLQRLGRVLHLRRHEGGLALRDPRAGQGQEGRRLGGPSASPTTRSGSRPTPAASAGWTWRTPIITWPRPTSSRSPRSWAGGRRRAGSPSISPTPTIPIRATASTAGAASGASSACSPRPSGSTPSPRTSRSRSSPTGRSASPRSWPSSATPTAGPTTT